MSTTINRIDQLHGTVVTPLTGNEVVVAVQTQGDVPVSLDLPVTDIWVSMPSSTIIAALSNALVIPLRAGRFTSSAAGLTIDAPYSVVTGTPSISAIGTGYAPLDLLYGPTGGTYKVATTQLATAVLKAPGNSGTPGSATVTGYTGQGTKFTLNVTIGSNGQISTINSIATPGSYTQNPANLTGEPIIGGNLQGASATITMGVATVTVILPDSTTSIPSNPVATTTNDIGSGATLTLSWATASELILNPTGAKLLMPGLQASTSYSNDTAAAAGGVVVGQLYRNGSVVQIRIT